MHHRKRIPWQNFISTVVETQLVAGATHESRPELALLLNRLDVFFVSAFALDLAVNAFAHWSRRPAPPRFFVSHATGIRICQH